MSDTETTKSIIDASYALLSGHAGEQRDWDRFRSLYAQGARMTPLELDANGNLIARIMSTDEWIAARTPFFAKEDFFEYETDREEHRNGRLAHVWSSYEAVREPGGEPIRKGVNSVQLWHDGSRWWILSIAWDAIEAKRRAEAPE